MRSQAVQGDPQVPFLQELGPCQYWPRPYYRPGPGPLLRVLGQRPQEKYVLGKRWHALCVFLGIFLLTWFCGLIATIITMLTIVRNISLVILAISINTYSYTIVAFALGFVILVNAELTRAYFPFQLAKEAILAWGANFSTRRYHEVLRYLNVHLTRRLIEALVKATLLTGILVSAFVAISSVSESYFTDSLLILFTTLIPVISGMMTYVRQLSDLERGAFKGAVLKSLPHPELWDSSRNPRSSSIQDSAYEPLMDSNQDGPYLRP